MTGNGNAYGTNLARVHAGALGHEDSPDGTDARNGFPAAPAHTHVGPAQGDHPNGSESNAHGVHTSGTNAPVGPRLDGNTDTRGLVDPEERERLQPFGNEVRAMRKAAGLTQEQLGKLAGIGVTHISRLEHGRRRPSVDAIKALARVMAPEGTTDTAEQRLARLAGDSLRTGAARRKRQRDNKHRRAALKQIERARRILNRPDPRYKQLLADEEAIAAHMRRELQEQDDPGIRGVTPIDDPGRRGGYAFGRPKSRSLKDTRAWLDAHDIGRDDDDDEL
jgi:transcriptional regulator with XRE-family HTH domain